MQKFSKICLVTSLLLGVSACKTTAVLFDDKKVYDHIYQEAADETIIASHKKFEVEPLEPTFFSNLLDTISDKKNPDSPLNIKVSEYIEKKQQQRQEMSRGLSSPLEMFEKTVSDIPETMSGKGAERIKAMLNIIIDKLLANWPGDQPQPPIEPVILHKSTYNAEMTGTNAMLVNAGLLTSIESEDELAAILAHELGHTLLNHFDSETQQFYESKKFAVMSLIGVAVLDKNGKSGGAKAMYANAALQTKMSTTLGLSQWMRSQEVHADLLATDLLYKAGYDRNAMKIVLEKLANNNAETTQNNEANYSEAEIFDSDTLNLQDEILKGAFQATNEMDTAIAKLLSGGDLMEEEDKQKLYTETHGLEDHPDISERIYNFTEYEATHYGQDIYLDPPKTLLLEKYIRSGAGKRALSRFERYQKAYEDFLEGNYKSTAAILTQLLDGPKDPDPLLRRLMFKTRTAQGQHDRAYKNLEIAIQSGNAPKDFYFFMMGELRASGRWQEALAFMDKNSSKIYDSPIDYYTARTKLLLAENQVEEARNTVESCKRHYPKNKFSCAQPYLDWKYPDQKGKSTFEANESDV